MDKYEIKELIGDYLEGTDTQDCSKELLLLALRGPINTNQGMQRYYVDIDTLQLEHIDLNEAVWSIGESESYKGSASEIVYFDELNSGSQLQQRILTQENGSEKWQCLESKILSKLAAVNG